MNEQEQSLIEGYIGGSLSEEELTIANRLMESSTEFAEEVSFQKMMLAHLEANIKNAQKRRLLEGLKEIKGETQEAKVIRFNPKIAWYSIAASILIVLGVFSYFNFGSPTSEEIYLSYYQPYDGVVNTRGDSKPIAEVISIYNVGEYQLALDNFLQVEELEGISSGQYSLLVANCYLNLDKPDNGIEWLNKISNNENSLIRANKDWYIALCFLKKGNIEMSKSQLQNIIDNNSVYSRKAKQLLKESIFNH